LGNTAAFMMIKKEIFTKLGGFNETYKECFEDVELNVLCLSRRLKNYFVPEAVCYHYESQTRNQNTEKNKREGEDLLNRLIPFIIKNKRSYEYFENISATQLNNLLQQRQKETQHEIRHQL
jgi:GT2 family glycosyltransferase